MGYYYKEYQREWIRKNREKFRATQRKYNASDKAKAARKRWKKENRDKVNAGYHRWKLKNKEKIAEYNRKYKITHKEYLTEYRKKYAPIANKREREKRENLKFAIFNKLGDKCKRCGFSDKRALQIDHVNGGGARDIGAMGAPTYYRKVLADNKGTYQILCSNCNWIKRWENNELGRKGM